MPRSWLISTTSREPAHVVKCLEIGEGCGEIDFCARLEPFLANANRNVAIFRVLDNALVSLHSLCGDETSRVWTSAAYNHLTSEFEMFARMSQTNNDVFTILNETCWALENVPLNKQSVEDAPSRKSIADPLVPKMRGPRTVCTSARVDHAGVPARTKMTDDFQIKVLGRSKTPVNKKSPKTPTKRKSHRCPVCRLEGHHARTCKDVLQEENRARADRYLKTLAETNKLGSYLKKKFVAL